MLAGYFVVFMVEQWSVDEEVKESFIFGKIIVVFFLSFFDLLCSLKCAVMLRQR